VLNVLTLNPISRRGLSRFPADRYRVAADVERPDVILVRSASLHGRIIPDGLLAVGRAGAGVNNIPIPEFSRRGVPVFNTPGANANAVKELAIAGLLLACRRICRGWDFARGLEGTDTEIHAAVEGGKKQFAGTELAGRTLGVIGLGAVGRNVANIGVALGMEVIGVDPGLTVEGAWQLSSAVGRARSLDDLLARAEFVTLHVPLAAATTHLIDAARISSMRPGAVLVNFARAEVVDERAVVAALDARHLDTYVSDFPSALTCRHPQCVTLPHLGASTQEAEENCAIMVVDQVRDFLERGVMRNAVNFPDVSAPPTTPHRFICANANVPNMLGQISDAFGHAGLNIHAMVNQARGDLAYTVVDLDAPVPADLVEQIAAIDGVLMARRIGE
jgi:D-3-phosphoglycerate dehydrogenase